MPGPPPAAVAVRPPVPLRMPQWAYSGAAATAALVFAVLVSADVTGLLAPDLPEETGVTAAAIQAAPERLQADSAAGPIELATPHAVPKDQGIVAEKGLSVAVVKETETAEAKAQAPTQRQAATPVQFALENAAKVDDSTPPVAAMAAAEAAEVAKAQSVPPPPEAAMAATTVEEVAKAESVLALSEATLAATSVEESAEAESVLPLSEAPVAATSAEESAEAGPTSPPPISALAAAEQPPEPTPVAQDLSRITPSSPGTNKIWRVLEGLAAVAAVAFLSIWLLRRRAAR